MRPTPRFRAFPSRYTLFTRLLNLRDRITDLFCRRSRIADRSAQLLLETMEDRYLPNGYPTVTDLISSLNPSYSGAAVVLTADVTSQSGTPTGQVEFLDGATIIGTGTLSLGVANFTTNSFSVGSHSLTAAYEGDSNFATSTSSSLTQVVNPATTTTISSSVNTSSSGQAITFTAQVSPVAPGSGTPNGTITFLDGGSVLGTASLNSGMATFTTSSLAAGSHIINADYGGSSSFGPSSNSMNQTVGSPSSGPSISLVSVQTVSGTEGSATPNQVLAVFQYNTGRASDYIASINWGDGVVSAGSVIDIGSSQVSVKANHIYAQYGVYNPVVTLSGDGAAAVGTTTATVADAPLTATGSTFSATAGYTFSGEVGTFTDPDADFVTYTGQYGNGDWTTYSATINWGDGTTSSGTAQEGTILGTHTYATGGVKAVTVTVEDQGGATASETTSVTVLQAPLAVIGTNLQTVEGQPFSGLVATYKYAAADWSSFLATINWGDNSQPSVGAVTAAGVTGAHTYATAGTYQVTVTMTTPAGAPGVGTSLMNVADAPLTLVPAAYVTAQDGVSASGPLATLTDPGGPTTYTVVVNWGDKTTSLGTVSGGVVYGTHTYTAPGSYPVTVEVFDAEGAEASANTTAIVTDAPLTVSNVSLSATEETPFIGQVATFTDSSPNWQPDTAEITWGDGSSSDGLISGTAIYGTHTFDLYGSYPLTVVLTNTAGDSATGTGTATVGQAPVQVFASKIRATAGTAFSGQVATFQDEGQPAAFTASVDWGDGTTTSGTISGTDVSGDYTYLSPGTYTVTVTVYENGVAATGSNAAVVAILPLQVTANSITATELTPPSSPWVVATFTDPDPVPGVTYSATVNWGDNGQSGQVTISGNQVLGSHTYQSAGVYPITVAVTRNNFGAGGLSTATAAVSPLGMTASMVAFSATAGTQFTGQVASVTEQGSGTPYSAVINWGDGTSSPGTFSGTAVYGVHTYMSGGPFTVTVQATDTEGNTASATGTDVVTIPPLTADGTTFTATEDALYSGSVATYDDGVGEYDSVTATIDWGDGTQSTGTGTGDSINGQHTYLNPTQTQYTVTVTILDADGSATTVTSVANIQPIPTNVTVENINPTEGQTFSGLIATIDTTTLAPSTFTCTIRWGDGSASTATATGGNGVYTISGSHTYSFVGNYPVYVTAYVGPNPDTGVGEADVAQAPVTVSATTIAEYENVQFIVEVASFSFNDNQAPNPFGMRASIDWGDGSTSIGTVMGDEVFAFHTYGSAGVYTTTVTMTDPLDGTWTGTGAAYILSPSPGGGGSSPPNPPPFPPPIVVGVTPLAGSIIEGQTFSGVVATFDPNDPPWPSGPYSATIDWGDGTPPTVATISGDDIDGSHLYKQDGLYVVQITFYDDGMSFNATTFIYVDVSPKNAYSGGIFVTTPNLGAQGTSQYLMNYAYPGTGGITGQYPLATIQDTNPYSDGIYAITEINWGDGNVSGGSVVPVYSPPTPDDGLFSIFGSHQYGQAGVYPITIEIFDFSPPTIGTPQHVTSPVPPPNTQYVPPNAIWGTTPFLTKGQGVVAEAEAIVLDPHDNTQTESITELANGYATMTESGGGQEYGYSVGASGSVSYTETYTENTLDGVTSVTEAGNLSASISASGDMYPLPFTIRNYSTSANGSYTATVGQTYGLMAVYSQNTGSGSGSYNASQSGDAYQTGSYSYEQSDDLVYSWSGAGDDNAGADREMAEAVAPDQTGEDIFGTFNETGSTNNNLMIQIGGECFSGDYKTASENYSTSTSLVQIGTDFGDAYTQTQFDSDTEVLSGSGNVFMGYDSLDPSTDTQTTSVDYTSSDSDQTTTVTNGQSSSLGGPQVTDLASYDYLAKQTGTSTEESATVTLQADGGDTTETDTINTTDTIDSRMQSMVWPPSASPPLKFGAYLWVVQVNSSNYLEDDSVDEGTDDQTDNISRQQPGTIAQTGNILTGQINYTDTRNGSGSDQDNGSDPSDGSNNALLQQTGWILRVATGNQLTPFSVEPQTTQAMGATGTIPYAYLTNTGLANPFNDLQRTVINNALMTEYTAIAPVSSLGTNTASTSPQPPSMQDVASRALLNLMGKSPPNTLNGTYLTTGIPIKITPVISLPTIRIPLFLTGIYLSFGGQVSAVGTFVQGSNGPLNVTMVSGELSGSGFASLCIGPLYFSIAVHGSIGMTSEVDNPGNIKQLLQIAQQTLQLGALNPPPTLPLPYNANPNVLAELPPMSRFSSYIGYALGNLPAFSTPPEIVPEPAGSSNTTTSDNIPKANMTETNTSIGVTFSLGVYNIVDLSYDITLSSSTLTETQQFYQTSTSTIDSNRLVTETQSEYATTTTTQLLVGNSWLTAASIQESSGPQTTRTTMTTINRSVVDVMNEIKNQSTDQLKFGFLNGFIYATLAVKPTTIVTTGNELITNGPSVTTEYQSISETDSTVTGWGTSLLNWVTALTTTGTRTSTSTETEVNQSSLSYENESENVTFTATVGNPGPGTWVSATGQYSNLQTESGQETISTSTSNMGHVSTTTDYGLISISAPETGNVVTQNYALTTYEQCPPTQSWTDTNQTQSINGSATGTSTMTSTETGNSIVNTFTLIENDNFIVTAPNYNENTTNQTLTVTKNGSMSQYNSTSETSNEIEGKYTETTTNTELMIVSTTEQNQTDTQISPAESDSVSTYTKSSGNAVTGTYTLTESNVTTTSATGTETVSTATAYLGNYTETTSDSTSLSSTGNDISGSYTDTTTDLAINVFQETATNYDSTTTGFTQTVTDNDNSNSTATEVEQGNSLWGGYQGTDNSQSTTTSTETVTNMPMSTSTTVTTNTSDSLSEIGNCITANYFEVGSANTTNIETSSVTNQSLSENDTSTTTDTATLIQAGNAETGNYSYIEFGPETYSSNDSSSNQSLTTTSTSTGSDTFFESGSGNEIAQASSSNRSSTGTETDTSSETNGTLSESTTATETDTVTSTQTDNAITGAYYLNEADNSDGTYTDGSTNGSLTITGSGIDATTMSTIENDNTVLGNTSVGESSSGSTSEWQTQTNQTWTANAFALTAHNETYNDNGNTYVGNDTISTSETTSWLQFEKTTNQSQTGWSTTSEYDTNSDNQTGNSVSGAYTATVSESTTTTVSDLDENKRGDRFDHGLHDRGLVRHGKPQREQRQLLRDRDRLVQQPPHDHHDIWPGLDNGKRPGKRQRHVRRERQFGDRVLHSYRDEHQPTIDGRERSQPDRYIQQQRIGDCHHHFHGDRQFRHGRLYRDRDRGLEPHEHKFGHQPKF